MSVRCIRPSTGLKGEINIPGDKSISHRSIMLGSIAQGTTEITHFLKGADCLSWFTGKGFAVLLSRLKH